MPTTIHQYPVEVSWSGGRDGHGSIAAGNSGEQIRIAVPPEYMGTGNGTNPEELLTSAIGACYSINFGIIAANRKLAVVSYSATAVGEVEQSGVQLTYKAVLIKPKIVLEASATDEQVELAHDIAHKADMYCLITNALRGKVVVTIEPMVERA